MLEYYYCLCNQIKLLFAIIDTNLFFPLKKKRNSRYLFVLVLADQKSFFGSYSVTLYVCVLCADIYSFIQAVCIIVLYVHITVYLLWLYYNSFVPHRLNLWHTHIVYVCQCSSDWKK